LKAKSNEHTSTTFHMKFEVRKIISTGALNDLKRYNARRGRGQIYGDE